MDGSLGRKQEITEIRIKKNTKGIAIAGCELKDTCYADDASFILGGSRQSFETLIDVLENLRCVSGLKFRELLLPLNSTGTSFFSKYVVFLVAPIRKTWHLFAFKI